MNSERMKMKLKLLFLFFFILSISIVFAQDKNNPKYKSAKEEATKAFQMGKYVEAAEAYQKAFSVVPEASLLYNIALSYEQGGKNKEAVEYYQRFCNESPKSKYFAQAQAKITELSNSLMKDAEDVTIQSTPPGAYIYINSKANGTIGQAPITTKLLAGEYLIMAEKEGFVASKQKVTVRSGAAVQVSLTLYDEDSVVPVRFLIDHVGAKVYVDNRLEGESPLTQPLKLRKGTRQVKIVKPSFTPWTQDIEVDGNGEKVVNVSLVKEGVTQLAAGGKGALRKAAPWVLMTLGLISTGVGAILGVNANSLYSQLNDLKEQGRPIDPRDIDAGNRYVLLTNLLIGFGAVNVSAGALWLVIDRDTDVSNATINANPKASLQQPIIPMVFMYQGEF
jgi:tetratricopeptide (TPR) repeat protein